MDSHLGICEGAKNPFDYHSGGYSSGDGCSFGGGTGSSGSEGSSGDGGGSFFGGGSGSGGSSGGCSKGGANPNGNNSHYTAEEMLNRTCTAAGMAFGVQGALADIAEALCKNDAVRQQLYSIAKNSVLAANSAKAISKGCGQVGLVLSIGSTYHSVIATIDGTGSEADTWNTISLVAAGAGIFCGGTIVGAPISLICGGISIGCSIYAEMISE